MDIRIEPRPDAQPELSIVLADWSVRESFHSLDYLNRQAAPRASYELIWVEYYDARPRGLVERLERADAAGGPSLLDGWIALEMPRDTYYHKHLIYNVGLIAARGRIVAFCDSDAMFPEDFVDRVVEAFRGRTHLALHLDEVRSADRRFYPFNHPTFEEVLASPCRNLVDGRPAGAPRPGGPPVEDPIHVANYGACLCARRDDLIAIGGADEHLDYLGHVCGPYDMTFRLVNAGCRERWHESAWIYHTWHPGAAGERNFVGPHDGRHMSTTALRARETGRVLPLVENPGVRALREECTRPMLACTPLELADAGRGARAWSDVALTYQPPRRRRRFGFLTRHPLLTAGLAARTLADTASYGALVARTTGAAYSNRPRAGSSEPRRSRRLATGARKAAKPFARGSLPLRLLRGVYRENRLVMARTRQKLEGLASEGVDAIFVYGPGFAAHAARAMAPEFGIAVVGAIDDVRGPSPRDAARHPESRVLIAARHGLAYRWERLRAAGFPDPALCVLEPAWLADERAARPELALEIDADLSVVLPTRGRPEMARRFLDQLHETAENPERLEIVLCLDEDDPSSHGVDHPKLRIQRLVLPPMTMGARTEIAARRSHGRRILLSNDDVEIRTRGWDRRLAAAFDRFPDGIALVYGNDLHQGASNATFPAVSREAMRAMGALTSPRLRHYHIESHLHDIFRKLRRLGHDRLVFVEDVVFEHFHPEGHERPQAAYGRDDRVTFSALAEERASAARRLALRIEARADASNAQAPVVEPDAALVWVRSPAGEEPDLTVVRIEDERGSAGRTALVPLSCDPGCSHEVLRIRSPLSRRPVLLHAALHAARGRALVFLDAGAVSEPGWGRRALAVLDGSTAAVWGPRVHPRNGRIVRAGARLEHRDGRRILAEPDRGRSADANAACAEANDDATGLFGLVADRRRVLEVGGLAPAFASDLAAGVDLCLRLADRGYAVRRAPGLVWQGPEPQPALTPEELARLADRRGGDHTLLK